MRFFNVSKVFPLLFGFIFYISFAVSAQSVLVDYQYNNGAVGYTNEHLSATPIVRGTGLYPVFGGNFQSYGFTGADESTSVVHEDYISFTISVDSGYLLEVNEIKLACSRDYEGPQNLVLKSSIDQYASNILEMNDLPYSEITKHSATIGQHTSIQESITFRLYGYAPLASSGVLSLESLESSIGIRLSGAITVAPTSVELVTTKVIVNEASSKCEICAKIDHPSQEEGTTVELVLVNGSALELSNYSTQQFNFPPESGLNQCIEILFEDNAVCGEGDRHFKFELQNVQGGNSASIGDLSTTELTILDDERALKTLAFQGFEMNDSWTIATGAASISGEEGASDLPKLERIAAGNHAWQLNNHTATLQLEDVILEGATEVVLSARVSSTSVAEADGAEITDYLKFFVSLDGAPYTTNADVEIQGNANARWGYTSGAATAQTNVGVSKVFLPIGGGARTDDGYSTVLINIPNGTSSVGLRIAGKNNRHGEVWNVDNIELIGFQCISPAVGFLEAHGTIIEGRGGQTIYKAAVYMENFDQDPVSLPIKLFHSTTNNDDLELLTPSITFTENGIEFVEVLIHGDCAMEADELFGLVIENPSEGEADIVHPNHNTTLVNDDFGDAPTVSFEMAEAVVSEGEGSFNIQLELAYPDCDNATEVDVVLVAGDPAKIGYMATQSVMFLAGQTEGLGNPITLDISTDLACLGNESFLFELQNTTTGVQIGQGTFELTIVEDDCVPSGLIINELGVGNAAKNQDYIELLVTGQPGETVDLRGWIIDDNNGGFTAGTGMDKHISQGHIRFTDHCNWANVPVGAIIVVVHAAESIEGIALDPKDGDLDYTYILHLEDEDFFEGASVSPSTSSANYSSGNSSANWGMIQINKDGDAVQIRNPAGVFESGISFGSNHATENDFSDTHHPNYSEFAEYATYFAAANGMKSYQFAHGNATVEYQDIRNWQVEDIENGSPGMPNNLANNTWINSLRAGFKIAKPTQAKTSEEAMSAICAWGSNQQKRFYTAPGDHQVIMQLINHTSFDHGMCTVKTYTDGTNATGVSVPLGRLKIDESVALVNQFWQVTPEFEQLAGANDYSIRLYLDSLSILNLGNYLGYDTNASDAVSTIVAQLRMYKTAGDTDPTMSTVNPSMVEEVAVHATALPGGYYQFEARFNTFSGFGLGVPNSATATPLSIVFTAFNGRVVNEIVQLDWQVGRDVNNPFFIVERGTDDGVFEQIGSMENVLASQNQYNFIDIAPLQETAYYRIKMIGDKHEVVYSSVRSITPAARKIDHFKVACFPNPVSNWLHLEVTEEMVGNHYIITNAQAGILQQGKILATEQKIPVARLANGHYQLEIQGKDQSAALSFIKQ